MIVLGLLLLAILGLAILLAATALPQLVPGLRLIASGGRGYRSA
jgi:hypothetical protein